jgi:hypothetical protein
VTAPGAPTKSEQALISATLAGKPYKCSKRPIHHIRAHVLRDLLLSKHGPVDPHGVQLVGARLTGSLDLQHVTAPTGLGLLGCQLDEPVRLQAAHLPWLSLLNVGLPALWADGLRIDGDLMLRRGSTVTGLVRLSGAHIGGQLLLDDAVLTNARGPALHADGIVVGDDVVLDRAEISGNGERGAIRFPGSRVTGQLSLVDVTVTNPDGPVLTADGGQFEGGVFLYRLTATGRDRSGAVTLRRVRVTGQILLRGATINNDAGCAVVADGLHVDGDLFTGEGFRATGTGRAGTMQLSGAHITGQVAFHGGSVTNQDGPALFAEWLRVDGDLFLREGAEFAGCGPIGVVHLASARIGGHVSVVDVALSNASGPLLSVEGVRAEGNFLAGRTVCRAIRDGAAVCHGGTDLVDLDGFEFGVLGAATWREWLHLIRWHTRGYRAQPYQQLAGVLKGLGHDRDAREVLIAQQEDLRARGQIGGDAARAVHWLWGALGGYGYRVGRIALALLLVLVLAGGAGWAAGHTPVGAGHHAAEHTKDASAPGTACSTLEQIGLGVDRGLPVGSTGIRAYCDLNTGTTAGQWYTLLIWVLQLFVWALATLAVAGYTGLIRKIT